MKKIFALLLIVCMAFSFAACGKGDDGEQTPVDVSAFNSAITATNPTGAVITVKTTTEIGDLNAKYTVAYNADGTAVVTYEVEKLNTFDPANPDAETKSTVTGTVNLAADGSYTGDALSGNVADIAAGVCVDLTAVADKATVNEAGDILTVVVPAASTESVIGTAVASDVTLVVTISGGTVEQINITYTGTEIVCKYN
jgi:hypothetical protein